MSIVFIIKQQPFAKGNLSVNNSLNNRVAAKREFKTEIFPFGQTPLLSLSQKQIEMLNRTAQFFRGAHLEYET